MERNRCLQGIRRKAQGYHDKRDALKEAAASAYREHGEDSPEYARCREEFLQLGACPVSEGEKAACRAEDMTLYWGSSEFEMEDSLWDKEVHDFVSTLRKAGIRTFVYTSRSSNALMNLCAFAEEGCRIGEVCTLRHKDDIHRQDVKGLRIHVS